MEFFYGTTGTFLASISALTLAWFAYTKWNARRNRLGSVERNLKFVNVENFFVGAMRGEDPGKSEDVVVKREGKLFGFIMFFKYTVMCAEPEMIQLVLSKEFTNFTNRRNFKSYDPIFSGALTVVVDEQWKRLRSIITPTFSAGKLRRMKPRIDDTIGTLLKNVENAMMEKGGIVNMKPMYGAFTMDTIIQVAFGTKVDSLVDEKNQIIVMAKRLFQQNLTLANVAKAAVVFLFPRIAHALNIRINGDVTDFFTQFSMEIIKNKREEFARSKSFAKVDSFIELLLEAEAENEKLMDSAVVGGDEEEKKSSKFMSNEEMIANCVLFFLAGYETTATTITMATYLIATNPEVQQKLHYELDTQLEKLREESNSDESDPIKLVTFETLNRFEYLNAVISETLRLYAPAPFTERTAAKDIRLETADGKHRINLKQGDVVHIPIYSAHHDPDQFPDPDTFNPDRFLGEPQFHKYSYLPFGSGPRSCVARSLALLEAKLSLLHVFNVYKLGPCAETKIPMQFFNQGSFITPKDCVLKVEKR